MPLRIFETRYLDMVSRCMKENSDFGVLLITDGGEIGDSETASVGTFAKIIDWYQGSDGILGVTAVGTDRFRLTRVERDPDGLYIGEVAAFEDEPAVKLPDEYRPMASLLEAIIDDLGKLYESLERKFDDACWVGCRFAEILPITLAQKQHCLEMFDPIERLRFVRPLLRQVRSERPQ